MIRLIVIGLILALLSLQYKLWLGGGGILQWFGMEHQLEKQLEKNEAIARGNQAIEADILELKQGDQALEERARYELGMVKEGEVYYQFMD